MSGSLCCPPLIPPNRLSVRADYLLWWSDGETVPALLTTARPETPVGVAGVLGEPSTRTLFGGERIQPDSQSGGRITLDYWFDDCRLAGIEASYLGVGKVTTGFTAGSNDAPILARPYRDLAVASEAAMLVAYPDLLDGSISAAVTSEFQTVEVLSRRALMRQCGTGVDFVVGWRMARLAESLAIAHRSEWVEAQGPIVVGTTKAVSDLFDTWNEFHGADLGLLLHTSNGPWSLDLLAKLGLGNSRSEVLIDGHTITTVPNAGSAMFAGGLLAQETNRGRYTQDNFCVIPELGVTVGYDMACNLRLMFGYTFLYWSEVARPGDQTDRGLSQLPPEPPSGARRPEFQFRTSDYWVQGMHIGLEYRF